MALPFEQVVKQLEDSGIVAAGKLEKFIPPKANPKSGEELVAELVKSQELTKFQAQYVNAGKSKSLILGAYTIIDKIGAGGMGQVFKALHRRMDRIVAIKMLPSAMTKDAAAAARFEREVRAAAKLEHPNIVTAYDADQANGAHFLVMQFVDGKDLSAMVKRDGPFPVSKAVNCVLQAAKGLEFAHSKGVIHRDVKPANLLLGSDGTVKILDMGLARIESPGEAQAELTGTGAVMGTVDYMSPEQAFNTKHADARADIYSLGCSLYYLVAGRATYGGETAVEKILAHRDKPIPSLRELYPEIPEQVDAVFRRMVAKKIEDRYQTMTEVVAELEKCQAALAAAATSSISVWEAPATVQSSDMSLLRQHQKLARIDPSDDPFAVAEPEKKKPRRAKTKTKSKLSRPVLIGLVAAGVLGVIALLAGVIFMFKTKDGTLIVEVNQPDAIVQVLDGEGKVEISEPGGLKPISISVVPGKHRIRVEKDGFAVITDNFEIESGGTLDIKARLVPKAKPAAGSGQQAAGAGAKPWETPAFQAWMKQVAAMPAEKQIEAVSKKLMELNPGFDGKLEGAGGGGTPNVQNGVVTGLRLNTDEVTDLSPLRALAGLKRLACGRTHQSRLADLSPLRGLSLEQFTCVHNSVSDLSPLEGMPLTELGFSGTKVSDLSPIRGMPLAYLNFQVSPVADLSPVRGMRLTSLNCGGSNVSDLSPIAGMPLVTLITVEPQKITKGIEDLRRMTSLKTIGTDGNNTWPAAEFWKKYDAGEFGKPGQPAAKPWETPAFQKWVAETQKLTAERQIEAVSKKLMELNPGFDGKLVGYYGEATPRIEDGVVTRVGFGTDNVTDISPVGALVGLRALYCAGSSPDKGRLSDLSPIHGMELTSLYCFNTPLSDLSPLKGMPLTYLSCMGTTVSDLAPVKGMPLATLWCERTLVTNLSAIQGMPLTFLSCAQTQVSDLSPLRGMPLAALYCDGTQVSDLSPLKGMSLQRLYCYGSKVFDFSPLQGMNLVEVRFTPKSITKGLDTIRQMKSLKVIGSDGVNKFTPAEFWKKYDAGEFGKPGQPAAGSTQQAAKPWETPAFQKWVADTQKLPAEKQIEAVSKKLMELNPGFDGKLTGYGYQGTPRVEKGVVAEIWFYADNVTDISPVRALAGLKTLACTSSSGKGRLSDLSPLAGMKLASLYCHNTEVSDLSPLRAMPLTLLGCAGTQVSDLSPLAGMKLTTLMCETTPVSDLSPLRGMPLANLTCGLTPISDLAPLQGMPLVGLRCMGTKVSDLSPLAGMNLSSFGFTPKNITKGLDIIRRMQSLKTMTVDAVNAVTPAEFWKKYDAGEFGKPAEKGLGAGGQGLGKAKLAYLEPAFQKWVADTQKLPAEQQIEAVSKKMMELNPGFDGKLSGHAGKATPMIENNVVTQLRLITDEVTDISPVRALAGLTLLDCSGGGTSDTIKGKQFADLSPLAGMKLVALICNRTQVSDLSPLRGMPLRTLGCSVSQVADLTPLAGMQVTDLVCYSTNISDLSPLRGMPLMVFACGRTPIADVSPLAGTNLTSLTFSPERITQGLDALRQMNSIKTIGLNSVQKWSPAEFWKKYDAGEFGKPAPKKLAYLDPAFQQWVAAIQKLPAEKQIEAVSKKLMELNPGFDGKLNPTVEKGVVTSLKLLTDPVIDLSPVVALAGLKTLSAGGQAWRHSLLNDLSPLRGLMLTSMSIGDSDVADLSPLQGMRLAFLNCGRSKVKDLSPLKGMKLTEISCSETAVSDLSPLQGMPLTYLYCNNTQVSDLSPLSGMPTLGSLDVRRTKVTAAQVAALQRALPNCKIDWDAVPPASPAGERAKPKTPEPAATGTK